ncbi:transcriptional regulator [Quadrisphaera granulorum]|uniref:Transcriptional regulator n=1 Tax=Quadrisphaera granulorum TaxID=317664 RepID=A0A316ADJ3_9ACTN|nr:sugar-binding domain-containing protein [Quadrisphaera granulorum]PWJ55682.1 transcriptional regulator [Quadrisphaera granulorum]SZE95179.1 transcriptional regulator [Quadrisphaera granulorum]
MATKAGGSYGAGGLALAVEAARRFYVEGASKVQIADELGVSRFKVARLLDTARAAGLVQITIGAPPQVDPYLSAGLRRALDLRHAVVLADGRGPVGKSSDDDDGDDDDGGERGPLGAAVGKLACDYLQHLVGPDDVVGLAWGHAMAALGGAWSERVAATFVQLAGSIARPDLALGAPELVRTTAERAGGRAACYYAPIVLPDAGSATALQQQIGVREAFGLLDGLTKAVVSIGAWSPRESTVYDALEEADRDRVTGAGVVAETTGLLLTAEGVVVDALPDRVVAVGETQLRRARVVAVAVGASRALAVRSVVRSGLVDTLVTHASLARALLVAS